MWRIPTKYYNDYLPPYKPINITSKDSVASLEYGSVAVYVTRVVPIVNVFPGLCVDVSVTWPELSLAVGGVQVTAAVFEFKPAFSVVVEGMPDITGISASVKVEPKWFA